MANKFIKTGKEIKCRTCAKSVYLMPYEIKLGRKKYCSKICLYKGDSYTKLYVTGHPKSFLDERVHTEETKNKISLSSKGQHSGSLAWNWIEDRTKIIGRHNRNLHDSEYKQWRKNICNRDNWKCKISNTECKGRLEVHHILGWKDHPELRYEVNNGITLCHFHHPRKRKDEVKLAPYFKELVTMPIYR